MVVEKKGLALLKGNKMEDKVEMDFDEEMSESEPESESEEEEDDEHVKLIEPLKTAVYNTDGLLDKLGDISWPDNVGWIHKLSIDIDQEQQVDVNDDLARELAFYNQALEGTKRAFEKLQSMGLPFLRPSDYYAEMVKTDSHMVKVKGRLLAEKRKIEEAEERRKARESKRLAKEIQAQKLKERAKQKKEEIESVKKWRKQRQQSGFAGGDKDGEMDFSFEDGKAFERSSKKRPGVAPGDWSGGKARQGGKGKIQKKRQFRDGDKDGEMDFSFEDGKAFERSSKKRPGVAPGDRSGGKARQGGKGKIQKKRQFRDSKFGFGGRKGLKKQNTAETTNDFRDFSRGNAKGNKKRKM